MKKIVYAFFVALGLSFSGTAAFSQDLPGLDSSPADIAYYPPRIANDKDLSKKPVVKVVYSRPQKKEREIFGKLEPYGKVWRAGANESTEIKFYQDVKLGGKAIKAGTYTLYVIPEKDKWTIIINSRLDKWGAYTYDQTLDVARVEVPVKPTPKTIEAFTIAFRDSTIANQPNMILAWDNTMVEVPVQF